MRWLAGAFAPGLACSGPAPAPSSAPSSTSTPIIANVPADATNVPAPEPEPTIAGARRIFVDILIPAEPWYAGKAGAYADCDVTPAGPASTFAAPFDTCPVVAETWSSPPGGSELHFRYLTFSSVATTAARATEPAACCYLVYEFPRRR